MLGDTWEQWNPPNVPHVKGTFTQRTIDPDTKLPEEQTVRARCEQCGATWQTRCSSGRVREHIQRFALVHAHRDPFDTSSK